MNSESTGTWPRVILFGDSLTEQAFSPHGTWGALLADALRRRADVINRGFSGYTSRDFRELLPSIVTPDGMSGAVAATVFLGTNDAKDPEIARWWVPVDEYKV